MLLIQKITHVYFCNISLNALSDLLVIVLHAMLGSAIIVQQYVYIAQLYYILLYYMNNVSSVRST